MIKEIHDVYGELPVAERNVADFIIKNSDKVLFMTVKELSAAVGVSEGTIVRMAQRCGFKGFSDFKIRLAVNFEQKSSLYQSIESVSEHQTAIRRVFETHTQALTDTLAGLNISVIEKVVSYITIARKVEFYGVGSAGLVAFDGAHKLKRMDIPAWGFADPHTQLAMASMLDANCVAIGITHSGMTRDTIEVLQAAKSSGAITVCITSNQHSPITKASDYILKTSVNEPVMQSGSVTARIAQMAVIDAITVGIHFSRKEKIGQLFNTTSLAVIDRKIGAQDESND
jgi:RpiR family carbohydrate utilization transcriptional regulator